MGVSRATVFNWFERDTPPDRSQMLVKLRHYLGADAEYILDGLTSKLDAEADGKAPPAVAAEALRVEIRERLEAALTLAADDLSRLGYLNEQTKASLRAPQHWEDHDAINRRADEMARQMTRDYQRRKDTALDAARSEGKEAKAGDRPA